MINKGVSGRYEGRVPRETIPPRFENFGEKNKKVPAEPTSEAKGMRSSSPDQLEKAERRVGGKKDLQK